MTLAYYRPATLTEALDVRAREDVVVLAGGTDVYPAKASRAGWGDMRHKDVLDISRITSLRDISEEPDHWRIGALTTWTQLIRAELPPLFDGLKAAAREVGGVQIQNRGTLAGNICTASPAGDGAPNLLALGASIEVARASGVRTVAMDDFIEGYRRTRCAADEIVTAILVPKRNRGARGHFLKLGARRYLVISIVMVAGLLETDAAGNVSSIGLAIGSCTAVPQRLHGLEVALTGRPAREMADIVAREHVHGLTPIDDIRGSAAYRREMALALLRDLLAGLAAPNARRAA